MEAADQHAAYTCEDCSGSLADVRVGGYITKVIDGVAVQKPLCVACAQTREGGLPVDQFPQVLKRLISDVYLGHRWEVGSFTKYVNRGRTAVALTLYVTNYRGIKLTLQENDADQGLYTLYFDDIQGHFFQSSRFPQIYDLVKALEATKGGKKEIGQIFCEILGDSDE